MRVLAGDVGGTKSLFGAFELDGERARVAAEARFASSDFDGAAPLLQAALDALEGPFDAVGLALPGPVARGECFVPKLGWTVREEDVRAATGTQRARLLNDFAAVGHGIERLAPEDLMAIQPGEPEPRGPRAILGAGTGLGEAFALWAEDGWSVHASEGGHCAFAPRTELEARFLFDLRERLGRRPSWDDVVSGRGLVHLWRFLTEREGMETAADVVREMEGSDPAAVVSRRGMEGTDAACERALEVFIACYAAEAGHQALRFVATGGVFLAGGITPKIAPLLDTDEFRGAFAGDSPVRRFVERVPLHAVLEPRVGLIGAAVAAVARRV